MTETETEIETQARPDTPSAAEVRAQVERMAVSDVFRTSPQLVAFLRFCVEAVLNGDGQRLKGYTIGVEVLRRDPTFDPQIDPIVRVEAARLRRTIGRYYAGPGLDDPVVIDLPRGGYAPTFSRLTIAAKRESPAVAAAPPRRAWPSWRWRAAALLAVATLVIAALWLWRTPTTATPPESGSAMSAALAPGNGMPVMVVEPFEVIGTPQPQSLLAGALLDHLSDAFARFDLVNVVNAGASRSATLADRPPGAAPRADFRFSGTVEYGADGAARIGLRLVEAARGDVIWSQVFERIPAGEGRAAAEETILRQVVPTLMQPFGVIYAQGRSRALAGGTMDPRYRCILDTAESFRSFDPAQHLAARACLERLTVADASFAIGFSYLAAIYLREYQYGIGAITADTPALERALRAARRGVELSPASSRAYEMLFVVLFARGELPAAFAAGDKAMSLNRHDARSRGAYGARLLASGEVDRGMALLEQATADGSIVPGFEQFFLFLGNYLRGDLARAGFHAGQLMNDNFQLGLVARALMANAIGDRESARRATGRLVELNRAWRDDLRGSLAKFFAAEAIIDRLAHDLGAAGLAGA